MIPDLRINSYRRRRRGIHGTRSGHRMVQSLHHLGRRPHRAGVEVLPVGLP